MPKHYLGLACIVVGFTGAAHASAELLSNEDILRLVSAGVGEGTVVAKIRSATTAFDTSVRLLRNNRRRPCIERFGVIRWGAGWNGWLGALAMDLFMTLVADRVAADNVLRKVDALVDWGRLGQVLGPVRSRLGRAGYDVELMIRVLLLGQWHSLSDRALEHALRVRLDFMLFCGSSVLDHCPDHTTICRFRQALVRRGLDAQLLTEVNRQLAGHGLKVERAPVAVVDATIVESAARPRRHVEVMAEDRGRGRGPGDAGDGAAVGGSGCALAEEGQPVFLRLQGVHPDRRGRVCGGGCWRGRRTKGKPRTSRRW